MQDVIKALAQFGFESTAEQLKIEFNNKDWLQARTILQQWQSSGVAQPDADGLDSRDKVKQLMSDSAQAIDLLDGKIKSNELAKLFKINCLHVFSSFFSCKF